MKLKTLKLQATLFKISKSSQTRSPDRERTSLSPTYTHEAHSNELISKQYGACTRACAHTHTRTSDNSFAAEDKARARRRRNEASVQRQPLAPQEAQAPPVNLHAVPSEQEASAPWSSGLPSDGGRCTLVFVRPSLT